MPPRSKVIDLPPAIRTWLEQEMVRRGFADYEQLAADLQAKGADISKSSLQRFGSTMAKLKSSVNMARALADEAPDDEGKLNEAMIRIAQEKIFNTLLEVDIDVTKVDINKLFKSAAEIGRASVTQKKWQVEARARAADVAETIGKEAKTLGASDDTIKTWREKVLGVVSK